MPDRTRRAARQHALQDGAELERGRPIDTGERLPLTALAGRKIGALSGIAAPESFEAFLRAKIVAIPGDIGRPLCNFTDEHFAELARDEVRLGWDLALIGQVYH